MPSSSTRKKNVSSNITRPSLIDTMLLTSTPLRRSPAIPSTATSTRSATNLTIFKEKNQTYEDMQLLSLTKNMNKKDKKSTPLSKNVRKRSKNRKSVIAEEDDDETENDEETKTKRKPPTNKRKTTAMKQPPEEPITKKLRRNAALNNKRATKPPIGKTKILLFFPINSKFHSRKIIRW